MPFVAKGIALPDALTDGDGTYRIDPTALEPGRYDLSVDYFGGVDQWSARAAVPVRVRGRR